MDFAKAFTYVFDDEEWTTKLPVAMIIGIIPIVNLAVIGWGLELIRNVMNGVEHPMPDWNDLGSQFSERWVAGLMTAIAFVIYYIPMLVISIIGGLIAGDSFVLNCGLSVLGFAYTAAVYLPLSIGMMRYANTKEFNHYLDFARNIDIAQKNLSTLLLLAAFVFLANLVIGLFSWIPCIGWLLGLVSLAVTTVIAGHLTGQAGVLIQQNAKRE